MGSKMILGCKTSALYIEENSLLPHIEFLVASVTLFGGNFAWNPRPNSLLAIGQGRAHKRSSTRHLLSKRSAESQIHDTTLEKDVHVLPHSLICSDEAENLRQRLPARWNPFARPVKTKVVPLDSAECNSTAITRT